jgi:hypothetical protein
MGTLALALAAGGCSEDADPSFSGDEATEGGEETGTGLETGDETSGLEEGGAEGGKEEGGESTEDGSEIGVPVLLKTVVDPLEVKAGYPVSVACVYFDGLGDVVAGGETEFSVIQGEGPHHVDDSQVTFEKVGSYRIQCTSVDGAFADPIPPEISVIAGDGTVVETSIDFTEVTAGEKISVTCTVEDAFGNLNEWTTTEVSYTPEGGHVPSGKSYKMIGAGVFEFACEVPATGAVDPTPVEVWVHPHVPKHIITTLSDTEIEAGGETEVTCLVTDAYNNPIEGFPLALQVPVQLTLEGAVLSTVVSGLYAVKCVPATDPWEFFEIDGEMLLVHPGPPYEIILDPIPPKAVYQKNDSVQLLISVLDAYANLIADAPIEPIQVSPAEGVTVIGTTNFKFKDEAVYVVAVVSAEDPTVHASIEFFVDGTGPSIVVDTPVRGATLQGKPAVTVEGFVTDDVAGVTSVLVNGQQANVKLDGSFSHIVLAKQGMNLIEVSAEDLGGIVTETKRSFYFSQEWFDIDASTPSQGMVDDGIQIWLGADFLDDGDHSAPADDLATILESVVGGLDLGALTGGGPIASAGPYDVLLSNLSFAPPTIGLDPFNGGLNLEMKLKNFQVDVDLKGECKILFIDFCPDFSGDISMSALDLHADILAETVNGQPKVTVVGVNVDIKGLDLDINGILGWLFDWLIDFIVDIFAEDIEELFEDQVGDLAGDLVLNLFEALALEASFEMDPFIGEGDSITLALKSDFASISFVEEGGMVGLKANIITDKKIAFDPLGSIGRAFCLQEGELPFNPDMSADFGLIMHDDLLNQALFSLWWGGLFEFEAGSELLGGNLDQIPIPGVTDATVKATFFTPPIITSCNPADQPKIQIGDIFLEVELDIGGLPLNAGIFISVEAEADIGSTTDPETGEAQFGVSIGALTKSVHEIVSITPGWESLIPVIEELIGEDLIASLVNGLGGEALGGIPIPSIDLSSLDPSIAPGTMLDLTIDVVERTLGNTAAYGTMGQ